MISLVLQATKPFIDPVTNRKIHFVEGAQQAALMAEKFDMDHMEECLGGRNPAPFDFEAFGAEMR